MDISVSNLPCEAKEEYCYAPINNKQAYIQVNYFGGNVSAHNLFCFEVTRIITTLNNTISDTKYLYLSLREIRTLYKDPKSIWKQAEGWEENKEEEEEENE